MYLFRGGIFGILFFLVIHSDETLLQINKKIKSKCGVSGEDILKVCLSVFLLKRKLELMCVMLFLKWKFAMASNSMRYIMDSEIIHSFWKDSEIIHSFWKD